MSTENREHSGTPVRSRVAQRSICTRLTSHPFVEFECLPRVPAPTRGMGQLQLRPELPTQPRDRIRGDFEHLSQAHRRALVVPSSPQELGTAEGGFGRELARTRVAVRHDAEGQCHASPLRVGGPPSAPTSTQLAGELPLFGRRTRPRKTAQSIPGGRTHPFRTPRRLCAGLVARESERDQGRYTDPPQPWASNSPRRVQAHGTKRSVRSRARCFRTRASSRRRARNKRTLASDGCKPHSFAVSTQLP